MTAIKALNAQGRHKAQFIVNAVLRYMMEDTATSKAVIPDTEDIRSICREIITEMLVDSKHSPPELIKEDKTIVHPSDQDFDYGAIADTLNDFRKK